MKKSLHGIEFNKEAKRISKGSSHEEKNHKQKSTIFSENLAW